ncbi:MAG: L-sorbose 1-phosphate reductase, partial [Christensenellales bacterium]
MKVTGLRMYGVNDLRVETFDLRDITDDEILVKIYTDSLCMSSYKAAIQGSKHKRVPDDI